MRLIGGIADHYGHLTGTVNSVREHVSGLSHLNKYRIEFFHASEDWFYEFQLAQADEREEEIVCDHASS